MNLTRIELARGRATCLHCHQTIVRVDDVGWFDPDGGDSYDMCPGDRFGNHEPDLRTRSAGDRPS